MESVNQSSPAESVQPFTDTRRLSLNQITINSLNLSQAVEACARHEIPCIGVWRNKIAEAGLNAAAKFIRDAGVRVSSVCRGGMFPAATKEERRARIEDNRQAIDEAAQLGADVLVLVCGAAHDRDIEGARAMVADGIAQLVTYASERGVRLGIEPLHPAFAAERSCITTLREARKLAAQFDSATIGVVVDIYHVWWDAELYEEIEQARGRILGFHVSDWLTPAINVLMNRGMMGDGVVELRRIRAAVEAAGYTDPIEVEIFNEAIWNAPADDVMRRMKERYLACV